MLRSHGEAFPAREAAALGVHRHQPLEKVGQCVCTSPLKHGVYQPRLWGSIFLILSKYYRGGSHLIMFGLLRDSETHWDDILF